MNSQITVVTGRRKVGKTTYCQQLITTAALEGRTIKGIMTPGRYDESGLRTGFYLQNVATGERTLLGSGLEDELHGTRIGFWTLNDQIVELGNAILATAFPTDILIIDEIGPLELSRSQGWSEAVPLLRRGQFGQAYVVVRPECLDDFRDLGFVFDCITIE